MDQRSFLNTRVRFQRLSDAKFFAGWVKDLCPTDVIIRVKNELPVRPGEVFMFQVHGNGASAMFKGVLSMSTFEDLCFSIPEPIKFLAANEEMRVMTDRMAGTITTPDATYDAIIMDVSPRGMGLLVADALTRGSEINVCVATSQGDVNCSGEVRYCKPDPVVTTQYRVGIQLHPLNRIDQARWNRLLKPEAA